jgi:SAM-dependent methyltransferase
MSGFADHFSAQAAAYREFRPHYPADLFAWIAALSPAHDRAWDCATGNGQAARGLAAHFQDVLATDASAAQIAQAEAHANIRYVVAPAANVVELAASSVAAVTVAQALHWFAEDSFYSEVRRVLQPDGVIVAWSYNLLRVDADVDALIDDFYYHTLAGCWPSARAHVENGYADLPFPFTAIAAPAFNLDAEWTLADVIAYFGTWSAVQQYRCIHAHDPLPSLAEKLRPLWGEARRTVSWPLIVRAGQV